MPPGPVFQVELLTLARRRRYYVLRLVYGLLLLYLIVENIPFAIWSAERGGAGEVSIAELAAIGSWIFMTFAYTQAVVLLLITPALVAGVVADERQRKTLGYLLASTLTSGEIVLGKLAARLIHIGVFLAVGLPILSLLSFFGGVDPNLVVLFFGACLSTAFLLSAASVLISVHAKRPREAVTVAYLVEFAWLFGPTIILGVFQSAGGGWAEFFEWVRPLNDWVGASSPLFVMGKVGFLPASNPIVLVTVFWMIGLQLLYGSVLSALAVARLRPVYRAEGKTGGRLIVAMIRRIQQPFPRPACGNDPIAWKERHVARARPLMRLLWFVVFVGVVALLGYTTYQFAAPAYKQVRERGYVNAAEHGQPNLYLSEYLRVASAVVAAVALIAVAGAAAIGLSSEREEDTWISLIATPLTPLEIIRGKMLGAVWSARWIGLVWFALVLTGLVLGAVHPVGFAACLASNAVAIGFASALGTVFSLRARNSARAVVATIAALIVFNGVYLLLLVPFQFRSSITLVGVTPYIGAISLLNYMNVRSLLEGGTYSPSGFGSIELLITYLLSMATYTTAAVALTCFLIVNFDDVIDRPRTFGGREPKGSARGIVFEDDHEGVDV